MQVKIVDTKEVKKDVVEMTIEELLEEHCAGYQWGSGDEDDSKYHLVYYMGGCLLARGQGHLSGGSDKALISQYATEGQFHVFDTAKKLFAWMAE